MSFLSYRLCRRFVACLVLAAIAPAADSAVAQAPADGKKLMPLEEGSVVTRDGMKITYSYLPGLNGKDSAVVVLLHMFQGNRHEMEGLGLALQKLGHAVFLPDLRGHGDSKTGEGRPRDLDASFMPIQEFANMVTMDLEALKKVIIEKNNAGALNVEKLCVVGAEMGAAVAVNWAALDWSVPPLANLKQGQDVKALVLLSPQMTFKPTLSLTKPLAYDPVRKQIAFFLIAGSEDLAGSRDVRQINDTLERARRPARPDQTVEKTVFVLMENLKTKLVGSKLLGEPTLGVETFIAEFIQTQVADKKLSWSERKSP